MLEAMILDEFGGRKAEGKGLCGPLGIELARKGRLQHVSFYRAGDKAAGGWEIGSEERCESAAFNLLVVLGGVALELARSCLLVLESGTKE